MTITEFEFPTIPEFLTPPQAAKIMAVGHEKVLGFINSGELRASNLAARRGGRPRYRIWRTDLLAFLASRAATPPPPKRRRRRKPDAGITQYY